MNQKRLESGGSSARTEATINANFSITNFYPKKIRGGVGDKLTILGSGFGNSYGNNVRLQFLNAENGGNPTTTVVGLKYLSNVDLNDIITWSDTRVVISFPGIISPSNGFFNTYGAPGSGLFLVGSYVGGNLVSYVTSPIAIDIEYCLDQNILQDGTKTRTFLVNNYFENCNKPNAIKFYVDPTIKNNVTVLGTIQKVLKDWSDVLKIDIRLAQDSDNKVQTATGQNVYNDSKSVIYLTTTLASNMAMRTTPYSLFSTTLGVCSFFAIPDIAINSTVNWHFTTGDTKPANKSDFYAALLHEVGHCLGVNHLIDEQTFGNDLMHYAEESVYTNSSIISANRVNLTSGKSRGLLAAQRQVADSKLATWNSTTVSNVINFTHPFDAVGCQNIGIAKMNVGITTAVGMSFKWQRFIQATLTWSNRDDTPNFYAGTTTPEFSIFNPSSVLGNTLFRCVITMPGGCVYQTNPATLRLYQTVTTLSELVS